MATHNGGVVNGVLYAKGDITWADKTDWSQYTKWIEYTDTTIETATGAKGQPLRWQSDIIDLGLAKTVYPQITVTTTGTPKVTLEYSQTSSDLSSKTTIGSYTIDNTTTGTIATYGVIDHMEPGYTDYDNGDVSSTVYKVGVYGFHARYIRVTVYVESFLPDGSRGQPQIDVITRHFRKDTVERLYNDADQNTFTYRNDLVTPYFWSLPKYGQHERIVNLQITPHYTSGYIDVKPFIKDKTGGGQFYMLDSNGASVETWTADVRIVTLPDVRETFNGIQKANK